MHEYDDTPVLFKYKKNVFCVDDLNSILAPVRVPSRIRLNTTVTEKVWRIFLFQGTELSICVNILKTVIMKRAFLH
jgi:hypothetical protein